MLHVLKKWYERQLYDEQAVVLLLLLLLLSAIIIFFGGILAPVIVKILALAFLLQGVVVQLGAIQLSSSFGGEFKFSFLGVFIDYWFNYCPTTGMLDQLTNLVQELPNFIAVLQEKLKPPRNVSNVDFWGASARVDRATKSRIRRAWSVEFFSFSVSKIPNLFSFMIYLVLVPILVFSFSRIASF